MDNLVLMMYLELDFNLVAEYLSKGTINSASSSVARIVKVRTKNYQIHEGELYPRRAGRLRFIPREKVRTSIVKGLHDEIGHWSFATTYEIISSSFWWPKIRIDFAQFVRSCYSCKKANSTEQNGPYRKMPVS